MSEYAKGGVVSGDPKPLPFDPHCEVIIAISPGQAKRYRHLLDEINRQRRDDDEANE